MQGALLHKHHEREIINHRTVSGHPSIISFHELFLMETHVVIVMEYATCGSLSSLLRHRRKLPEVEARRLFWQLLRGLQHCHSRDVFHRCSAFHCCTFASMHYYCACRESLINAPNKMFHRVFLVSLWTKCSSVIKLWKNLTFVAMTPLKRSKHTGLVTELMFAFEHNAHTRGFM